jgi:hypothetical protein
MAELLGNKAGLKFQTKDIILEVDGSINMLFI